MNCAEVKVIFLEAFGFAAEFAMQGSKEETASFLAAS
jgi:hypothetical protein